MFICGPSRMFYRLKKLWKGPTIIHLCLIFLLIWITLSEAKMVYVVNSVYVFTIYLVGVLFQLFNVQVIVVSLLYLSRIVRLWIKRENSEIRCKIICWWIHHCRQLCTCCVASVTYAVCFLEKIGIMVLPESNIVDYFSKSWPVWVVSLSLYWFSDVTVCLQ